MRRIAFVSWIAVALAGCATAEDADVAHIDAGKTDSSAADSTPADTGASVDTSAPDTTPIDTSTPDTSIVDSATDSASDAVFDSFVSDSASDVGADTGSDSGSGLDSGSDSGSDSADASPPTGSVVVTPAADTAMHGGSGGGVSLDDCPAGQLPTGVELQVADAYYSGAIGQYRTKCSVAKVDATGTKVTLSVGVTMPASGWHGSYAYLQAAVSSSCPTDQVIVGLEGRASTWMNAISLRCAPLTVAGSVVTIGTVTTQTSVGSSSGTAFTASDCATGTIARGVTVQSGEVLDGLGLRCGTPSIAP